MSKTRGITKRRLDKLRAITTEGWEGEAAHPHVFIQDGFVKVDVESDGGLFGDYYGDHRGGYAGIHPDLESFAEYMGTYWEWDNPGGISLYDREVKA